MVSENIDGILIVDKPANMSSAAVVSVVKKKLQVDKVGHAGTLDPFAEGVLICCINRATRLAGFLLHGTKKYVATLKLGEETDTQDKTGSVISTADTVEYSRQAIHTVCESFIGVIEQLPPVYSALKHRGVPLYKLARRGQAVQKPPRPVEIYNLDIEKIDLPYVCFKVSCSAGTYIRTLGADIGRKLGCGGHLVGLRRTESSGFKRHQAVTVKELDNPDVRQRIADSIINMKDALPDVPNFYANERLARKVRHGQKLGLSDVRNLSIAGCELEIGPYLKIVDRDDDLIAIMEYSASTEHLKYACVFPK
jgi:tRNA pseudouridine55 synthase